MKYQIGSDEPRGCVGSRAAKSNALDDAITECCQHSRARFVKRAWLREWIGGKLGPVIVSFRKGAKVD